VSEKTAKLSVIHTFSQLPDEKKIKFTDTNIQALKKTMSNPQAKVAFFQKFFSILLAPEKANVNPQDLKILLQILVSFLFSLKPEFMYDWAEIIDLTIGYPLPKNFEERKQYVKQRKWFHVDLPPDLWNKVNEKMNELGSVEAFFNQAIIALSKPEKQKSKR
jgi:hypothetical protein